MSAPFECECIFVQLRNADHPGSGCIEYRAETCPVCRLLDTRLLAGRPAAAVFEAEAPRYQRVH